MHFQCKTFSDFLNSLKITELLKWFFSLKLNKIFLFDFQSLRNLCIFNAEWFSFLRMVSIGK